jgi:hypothetical protein
MADSSRFRLIRDDQNRTIARLSWNQNFEGLAQFGAYPSGGGNGGLQERINNPTIEADIRFAIVPASMARNPNLAS